MKTNILRKTILSFFVVLTPLLASSHNFEVNGIYYKITSYIDLTVAVTFRGDYSNSYSNEYTGTVTIPVTVTYDGVEYSVTGIRWCAFEDCSNLTAITIPESVTSIESEAFSNCSNLTTITIPEGVTSIESSAFSGCSSLTAITIPESVTSIGEYAFYDCSGLKMVTNYSDLPIERGSSDYGHVAYYADKVINIDEVIDGYAFKTTDGVHYLTGYIGDEIELTLPTDYEGENYQIGDYAFYQCSSLTSITISEDSKLTSIGYYAFAGCGSLTAVYISSLEAWCKISFDSDSSNPLDDAKNLYLNGELVTELIIPEGVTSIGDRVFSGCSSLTAITIPESVTSIGQSAFDNCAALKKVIIEDGSETLTLGYNSYSPSWVSIPGEGLFYDCPLESVYLGRNLSYNTSHRFGFSPFYREGRNLTITLGDHITAISPYLFYESTSLTSISIPEGVTSIGEYAFCDCSSLTAITIPEGVTSIGDYAFIGCTNLTTITIPSSVTSIGWAIFAGCDSLKNVYCYAEKVPSARGFWFIAISEHATLHVPENALEAYKSDASWGHFPSIVALTEEEMGVEQSVIEEQHEIYNLQGHRVTHPTKGIYIVNGKKVVIK